MENRDSNEVVSKLEKESESSTNFGKNIGRSEDLGDEPSRKSGSSGMKGEIGRSSNLDKEDLGSESELDEEDLEAP